MRHVVCVLASLLILTLLSCEKEIAISPDLLEKKLVIQSLISPQDTLITVFVSTTRPLVGKVDSTNRWITNAKVAISDGQREVILSYSKQGIYLYKVGPSFSILPNKTYTLRISTPEGLSAISSCTVPTTFLDTQDIIVEKQTIDEQKFRFTISWPVRPNNKNIFGIWTGFEKPVIQCGTSNTSYISDLGTKNTTLIFTTGFFQNVCNSSKGPVSVVLSVFDNNFYDFYNALDQQTQTNGIPFTEPVQLFTNIDGGYGIFSAYTVLRKKISL